MNEMESRYLKVKESKIHYIESGKGDPILFIHGMPTYSYVWRKIIPEMSNYGRCIAPDLIGMGLSDKPDIEYRITDHIEYINEFISQLDLKNITLVLHGWGSVVGFDYAKNNSENVKAIAFYESYLRPDTDWNMLSLPLQQLATLLNRPGASYRAIVMQNYFINKLLQNACLRKFSSEEFENYRKPFPTPESRKPLWQYIQDLPMGSKKPASVVKLMNEYSEWLQKTTIPKLMLYAVPGFLTTMDTVQWAKKNLKNLSMVELENALHFGQESSSELFVQGLEDWYLKLSTKTVKKEVVRE